MQSYHNIEKSAFRKDEYVGYSQGEIFHIVKHGKREWTAFDEYWLRVYGPVPTLRDISLFLENFIPA